MDDDGEIGVKIVVLRNENWYDFKIYSAFEGELLKKVEGYGSSNACLHGAVEACHRKKWPKWRIDGVEFE